ncbi:MAG: C69 family dipeptidase [Actinobacteria bacterium]|nr:C69 family dipeptidase [Actinomycetota bacterium]MBV9933439.1 C69 family dipeptidase [Actinomycetota bacterium]
MCDCLVALAPATEAGCVLFAKNSDRPRGEAQLLEWVPPRRDDGAVRATYVDVEPFGGDTVGALISRPWWMWGAEHGVNEASVAAGNATIYTTLDPRNAPAALTGMDLVRLALERSTSAAEAVEVITSLLERYGQGGSGHHGADHPYWSSFLVADPSSAFTIETSGRTWEAEEVVRTRATSNRTTIPSFDANHRHPRQPVERLVDPRLHASHAVLAAEPVNVDGLMAHLRSHAGEEGYSVCMHAHDQETTASMIAELPAAGPPRVWVATGSPCQTEYTERDLGLA